MCPLTLLAYVDPHRNGAIVLAKYEGYFESNKVCSAHKTFVDNMLCLQRNPAFFIYIFLVLIKAKYVPCIVFSFNKLHSLKTVFRDCAIVLAKYELRYFDTMKGIVSHVKLYPPTAALNTIQCFSILYF